jgi:hypothetical protein
VYYSLRSEGVDSRAWKESTAPPNPAYGTGRDSCFRTGDTSHCTWLLVGLPGELRLTSANFAYCRERAINGDIPSACEGPAGIGEQAL